MMSEQTHGYDYQVLLKRNQHGGISEDKVRGGVVKRYRSTPDARLFEAMNGQQEGAYHNIGLAHQLRTAGLGAKISKYGDFVASTGAGDLEHGAELVARYDAWHVACKKVYLSPILALEIIVYGLSPAATDKKYKFGHGAALKNLLKCLDKWDSV